MGAQAVKRGMPRIRLLSGNAEDVIEAGTINTYQQKGSCGRGNAGR
jgi:hypothetical protein